MRKPWGGRWVNPLSAPYAAGKLGHYHAARALDEAFSLVHKNKELFAEAEWHRLRGDLLLAHSGDRPGAESCYRHALATARRQGARLPELRGATSLARLLQSQGQVAEARRELAAVDRWFAEGFDSADLKEARELLDGLKGP